MIVLFTCCYFYVELSNKYFGIVEVELVWYKWCVIGIDIM